MKTVKFKTPGYIGDPINAIRIYNEKEVDELIFLDITATIEYRKPSFNIISEIASECFMPVAYGGGIRDLDDIMKIFKLGIEKVVINTYAIENPNFIKLAAERFGNQSIVVSIDAQKKMFGQYEVYTQGGRKGTSLDPVDWAVRAESLGAGEIMLTSIDRDGTQAGYDLDLIKRVTSVVNIPVIASGGAGNLEDFGKAVKISNASACAVGSMVVYFGPNRAVLINFPTQEELAKVLD